MVRKRPCAICRRWFCPDPRVGDLQRVCSSEACQAKRLRLKQADWRRRNPSYFAELRWAARASGSNARPSQHPPPLDRVPWTVVQSQMQSQPAVILGLLVRLLLVHRAIAEARASARPARGKRPTSPPGGAIADGRRPAGPAG
jgi:hypothetical protein